MTIFEAVAIAEGNTELVNDDTLDELTQDEEGVTLQAWQTLVNSGVAWQLQGWFGRRAAALIDAGLISGRAA